MSEIQKKKSKVEEKVFSYHSYCRAEVSEI